MILANSSMTIPLSYFMVTLISGMDDYFEEVAGMA
jgi:hypothetical protein